MEESKIFKIRNCDKRREFIEKMESGETFIAQKPRGVDVEKFDSDYGFYLERKEIPVDIKKKFVRRALACAKLSLRAKYELREFYYTGRGMDWFTQLMDVGNAKYLYQEVLKAINDLEILCDIDRSQFTMGNLSKGFMFYEHSYTYGDKYKRIAFTEILAREKLRDWELENLQSILIIEKNSSATRLVEMGFSKITNSMIVTVGGFFNRAIYELVKRYKEKYPIVFFCDADVFGNKMLSTIVFGSERSRHLDYKFNPKIYPNIHIAGLYPSVAEYLGLENDVEEKRPLQNEYVRRMLDHIKKFGLVDERDIETWKRDKTYELEALASKFTDDDNNPIGLGIYLLEYFRLKNIPIKPIPTEEEAMNEFIETAKEYMKDLVEDRLRNKRSEIINTQPIEDVLEEFIESIRRPLEGRLEEWIHEHLEDVLKEIEEELSKEETEVLMSNIIKQYCDDITLPRYNMRKIVRRVIKNVLIEVVIDKIELQNLIERIAEQLRQILEEYREQVESEVEEVAESMEAWIEYQINRLKKEKTKDLYDVALEYLKAKREDVEKIREALKWRLGN